MTDIAFTNTQQKNKAKLIILTNNSIIKDKHLDIAKKNRVNIIRTPYDTFKVSKLVHLCNYVHTINNDINIIYLLCVHNYISELILKL